MNTPLESTLQAHDPMLDVDLGLQITWINEAFLRTFTCRAHDILGEPVSVLFSPNDKHGTAAFYRKIASGQHIFDTFIGVQFHGHQRPMRLRVFHNGDEGWRLHLEDIAESGKALWNLLLEHRRWSAVINETDNGIASLDADRRIAALNPAFIRMMRFATRHGVTLSRESIIGKDILDLLPTHRFTEVRAALSREKARDRRYQGTIEDEKAIFEVELSPLLNQGRVFMGYSLLVRDRTARHALEKLSRDHARSEGKAEVAVGVVHNVGNVLNSVNVSAELLHEKLQASKASNVTRVAAMVEDRLMAQNSPFLTDPTGRKLITYLKTLGETLEEEREALAAESVAMLKRLWHIGTLISMQREHTSGPSLERSSIKQLLEEALVLVDIAHEQHNIEVSISCRQDLVASIDRHGVLQILVNLLSNARSALIGTTHPRQVSIEVLAAEAGWFTIEVKDNGVGIPEENLLKIFRRDFTTRADGLGVGLHNAGNTAKAMRGELTCHSEGVGRGAVFTLKLPMEPPAM